MASKKLAKQHQDSMETGITEKILEKFNDEWMEKLIEKITAKVSNKFQEKLDAQDKKNKDIRKPSK